MGIQETLSPYQLIVRKGMLVEFINEKLQLTRAKITSNPLVTQNKRDHLLGLKSRHYKVQEETGREYVLNFGQDGNSGFLYVARKQSEEGKTPGLMELIRELTEAEKMEGHMREISVVPPEEHELNDPLSDEEFLDTGKINLSKVMEENGLGEYVDMKQVRALQSMANTIRDKVLLLQADKLKGHISAEKTKTYIQEKEVVRKKFEHLKVSQGDNADPEKASRIINEVMKAWEKLIGSVSAAEAILGIPMASESILQMSAIASPDDLIGLQNLDENSKDEEGNPKESTTNKGATEQDQEEAEEEASVTQERLRAKVKDLETENNIFEIQNKNLNLKADDLQGRNNQLEVQNISLEQEVFNLKNQLETQRENLSLKANKLKEDRDKIEEEKDQEARDYLNRISELSDQNDLLRIQLEEAGSKQEEAVSDLRREMMALNDSLIKTQGELNVYKSKEAVARSTQPLATHTPTSPATAPVVVSEISTITTQAERELEGRFRRLMIESEAIAEKINQDIIKSKEDMEQMRSDVIKDGISIKGRTSRTKAMDKIIEFKQSLKYFQSDADCGLIPATEKHKEEIRKEIEKQDHLMNAVSQTNLDFIRESEQRNIRLIEMNQVDSKMLASSTPKFTGEGSLHIYQFIKNMDTHLKQRGVLHEDSGLILREFCSGKAKTILDGSLRDNANPRPEEIKRILVSHFGNRERILLEIQKEHESLGQIPHPCLLGSASNSFSLSERHLSLLDKVEVLTKTTTYDLDQTIPIDLGELKLKAYADSMLPLLPMEFFREFRRDMRDTTVNNTTLLEKLKAILHDIKLTAFENIQSQDMEREKRQKKQPAARAFTAITQPEGDAKCSICIMMKRDHNREPPKEIHALYENKNNRLCVKPESCSFISELDIMERRNFCDRFRLCPVCLTCKEDSIHNRDNCDFVRRCRSFKCRDQECEERFSMCLDHQYLNIEALEKTQRLLARDNCQFNW